MEQISLPTVTLEDLARFQAEHFQQLCFPFNITENDGYERAAEAYADTHGQDEDEEVEIEGNEEEEEEEEEEEDDDDDDDDDGLGYYADGVKRTLSDEQVKIFRHSEIHSLLRERQRLREEEGKEEEEEEDDYENKDALADNQSPNGQQQAVSKTRNNNKRANDVEDETAEQNVKDRPAKQPKHNPTVEAYSQRKIVSYSDD